VAWVGTRWSWVLINEAFAVGFDLRGICVAASLLYIYISSLYSNKCHENDFCDEFAKKYIESGKIAP
jgi:hypothetical protein